MAVSSCRLLRYYDAQALFLVNLSRCLRFGLGLFGGLGLLVLFARHFPRLQESDLCPLLGIQVMLRIGAAFPFEPGFA